MTEASEAERISARQINDTIRYTMWSVFAAADLPADRSGIVDEVDALLGELAGKDLVVRGWYDVAGLRADADLMVRKPAPLVPTRTHRLPLGTLPLLT